MTLKLRNQSLRNPDNFILPSQFAQSKCICDYIMIRWIKPFSILVTKSYLPSADEMNDCLCMNNCISWIWIGKKWADKISSPSYRHLQISNHVWRSYSLPWPLTWQRKVQDRDWNNEGARALAPFLLLMDDTLQAKQHTLGRESEPEDFGFRAGEASE